MGPQFSTALALKRDPNSENYPFDSCGVAGFMSISQALWAHLKTSCVGNFGLGDQGSVGCREPLFPLRLSGMHNSGHGPVVRSCEGYKTLNPKP